MFGLDLSICSDVPLPVFIILSILVIFLGSGANLATVANTIAIEKDWIVVIADKNKDTLAGKSVMQRRLEVVVILHNCHMTTHCPRMQSMLKNAIARKIS